MSLFSFNRKQTSWFSDIVLLSVVIGFFYFFYLGSYPLFTPDEGRYSEAAREMLRTGDYITPRVNGITFLDKPILYYWLQTLAIALFGLKEWALRFFPCFFGLAGIICTYVSGRLLYDRGTGLLAALLLATSPLYFIGAHYANLDLEVAVWISASLFAFLLALKNKKLNFICLLLAYVFSALAFLTKGMIGVAFPAAIVGLWILSTERFYLFKTLRLHIGILIFLAITAPWYYLAQRANPAFFNYFFVTQQVTRFLSAGDFNNKTPFWFYLPVIALGFFPWSIFLVQAIYDNVKRIKHSVELYLLIWVGVIFLFFSVPHSKIITYILPIFPALALMTARTLYEYCSAKINVRYLSMSLSAAALLVAMGVMSLPFIQLLPMETAFLPYLYAIAGILFTFALFTLIYTKTNNLSVIVNIGIISSGLILFTLTMSAEHLNQTSTKTLSGKLVTLLKPEDEIVNYYKFYQDLPLYLQRQVTIVADWSDPEIVTRDNWLREMWYGRQFQRDSDWLIDEKTFWQHWRGGKRVYVFVNVNYLEQFKRHTRNYYYVDKHNDVLVLSNKPVFLQVLS